MNQFLDFGFAQPLISVCVFIKHTYRNHLKYVILSFTAINLLMFLLKCVGPFNIGRKKRSPQDTRFFINSNQVVIIVVVMAVVVIIVVVIVMVIVFFIFLCSGRWRRFCSLLPRFTSQQERLSDWWSHIACKWYPFVVPLYKWFSSGKKYFCPRIFNCKALLHRTVLCNKGLLHRTVLCNKGLLHRKSGAACND